MCELVFSYFAMALFRTSRGFEIQVVQVQAATLEGALKVASERMERYALDFEVEYSGALNVYESGSDMLEEYGEVFSLTCESDTLFESMFEKKLRSSLGIRNTFA